MSFSPTLLLGVTTAAAGSLPSLERPLKTGDVAPDDAAVIIGNERYVYAPEVPFAERDSDLVYDYLVYTRGVHASRVTLLQTTSREKILAALADGASAVGRDGILWVYFAGHGIADPETGERTLLGSDAELDQVSIQARGIRTSELTESARREGVRAVVIVDACFGGSGRDGESLMEGKRFAVPVATTPGVPEELIVMWSATSASELASPLEEVGHGAFTYLAVGALRGWADGELDQAPDGLVTAGEAQAFVHRSLRHLDLRDQQPTLHGSEAWTLSSSSVLEPPPEFGLGQYTPSRRAGWILDGSLAAAGVALLATGAALEVRVKRDEDAASRSETAVRGGINTTYSAGYASLAASAALGLALLRDRPADATAAAITWRSTW